jgi:hypothetical protein
MLFPFLLQEYILSIIEHEEMQTEQEFVIVD